MLGYNFEFVHDQIPFSKGLRFSETNDNISMRSTHCGMRVRSVQQKGRRQYFSNLIVLYDVAHAIITSGSISEHGSG